MEKSVSDGNHRLTNNLCLTDITLNIYPVSLEMKTSRFALAAITESAGWQEEVTNAHHPDL